MQIDQLGERVDEQWNQILSSATKTLYGLPQDAIPDDAFVALRLGTGYYGYRFKVTLEDGSPCAGAAISGEGLSVLEGMPSNSNITNDNGLALLRATTTSLSDINISSPYIDISPVSGLSFTSSGLISSINITLQFNDTMQKITSSRSVMHSNLTSEIKITTVGGGGGGGKGTAGDYYANGGGGGGGGYVSTASLVPTPNVKMNLSVGSGGIGGSYNSYNGTWTNPGKGGTTSLSIDGLIKVSSAGGSGGGNGTGNSGGKGFGGSGNGNGGSGVGNNGIPGFPGTDGSGYIFDTPSLGLAGGGGGGGGSPAQRLTSGSISASPGGSPYGGRGGFSYNGNIYAPPTSGGYGGGGGGGNGYADSNFGNVGASGGKGIIYIQFSKSY